MMSKEIDWTNKYNVESYYWFKAKSDININYHRFHKGDIFGVSYGKIIMNSEGFILKRLFLLYYNEDIQEFRLKQLHDSYSIEYFLHNHSIMNDITIPYIREYKLNNILNE